MVVTPAAAGSIEVRFRLQRISAPESTEPRFVEVRLTIRDGKMLVPESGAQVRLEVRNDLQLPEETP
ncbi:MAG: hypothetical protein ACRD1Q_17840 [Vicinamibacterales bacterium]